MIRTKEEYYKFRDSIQSKITGANIHFINGKLGNILDRCSALENPSKFWDKHRENYKVQIDKYYQQILNKLNE